MYFFSFDTTISRSRSTMSLRCTALDMPVAGAVAGAGSPTIRRGAGGAGAPGEVGVPCEVGVPDEDIRANGAPGLLCESGRAGGGGAPGVNGRVFDGAGAVGVNVLTPAAGVMVRGEAVDIRLGSGGWLFSSCSHVARLGAILSSAHASRWRSVATWLSQHITEQNTRRIRARLQVETLHWKYFEPKVISVRQALHRSQVSAMATA